MVARAIQKAQRKMATVKAVGGGVPISGRGDSRGIGCGKDQAPNGRIIR